MPRFHEVENELRNVGVNKLLGEISSSDVVPESWSDRATSARQIAWPELDVDG